jgi:hypothetical protein
MRPSRAARRTIDAFRTPYGSELADLIAASDGILGGVTCIVGGVHGRLLDDTSALDPIYKGSTVPGQFVGL